MSEMWVEKYRPRLLKEVIGNKQALEKLKIWGEEWASGKIKKKAVILSGKPGIGKTSAAHALANEFGWLPIEVNASDARNAKSIDNIILRGGIYGDLFGSQTRKKLLIIDEADNLYERIQDGIADEEEEVEEEEKKDYSDRGGASAIIRAILQTKNPIILIVNDEYELTRKGRFKDLCEIIRFKRVEKREIKKLLAKIADAENLKIPESTIEMIAERSNGDVRSAVNDLQSLAIGRTEILPEDTVGVRDRESDVYALLAAIFKEKNLKKAREIQRMVDEEPEKLSLWVDENLPRAYQKVEDLAAGYDALSKADIFFGRVYRRNKYGFWKYALALMLGGVAVAKKSEPRFQQFSFPMILLKMRDSKVARESLYALNYKIGRVCHLSIQKTKDEIYPYFTYIFQHNDEFRRAMVKRLHLSPEDVRFIFGNDERVENLIKDLFSIKSEKEREKPKSVDRMQKTLTDLSSD
ncbi:MAG: replication factor C large subunit [Thermoplasmata archaeon]